MTIENIVRHGHMSSRWRMYCDACGIVGADTDEATATRQSREHNAETHRHATRVDIERDLVRP